MICLRTLLRIYGKKSNPKKLKNNKFFGYLSYPNFKIIIYFLGIAPKPDIGIL
jgi:hypothetical protein